MAIEKWLKSRDNELSKNGSLETFLELCNKIQGSFFLRKDPKEKGLVEGLIESCLLDRCKVHVITLLKKECMDYRNHLNGRERKLLSTKSTSLKINQSTLEISNKIALKKESINKLIDSLNDNHDSFKMNTEYVLAIDESKSTPKSSADCKEKLDNFKAIFDTDKEKLSATTQKTASFFKKIGAILSCAFLLGIYKAVKSPTFFGKSHGYALSNSIEKILNANNTIGRQTSKIPYLVEVESNGDDESLSQNLVL